MFDAIVVGAGHAGCEAAHILAKMGKKTALITINLEHIAKMPCNPSIGGPAKGIVVREVDALGGIMPRIADKTALQFKMLNSAKGPGVRALRVQSDKLAYSALMRKTLEQMDDLTIIEDIVEGLIVEDNKCVGVKLSSKDIYAKAVVLTTGTYMDSLVMISDEVKSSGPDGDKTTKNLSKCLSDLGLELFRLKTGTPPRVYTDSIDFSRTVLEKGDDEFLHFAQETTKDEVLPPERQLPCYLTHTTLKTKEIIQNNMHRSSMYSGVVKGVGPRYCPSIEDKVKRFSDKDVHQIFLEPESLELDTTYIQGFSSSLPREVQEEMLVTVTGLEHARIKKYAYAIEYDAINPLDVKINLETRKIENLFIGGQILGTSGYEEAAGLGIMAGINASLKIDGQEPFILKRDEAYIGVMIDDLITKGTNEPYRLLTSRAEYRLLLRHDNAEQRLISYAHQLGTVSDLRYQNYLDKEHRKEKAIETLKQIKFPVDSRINDYLVELGFEPLSVGTNGYELLRRPKVSICKLNEFTDDPIDEDIINELEIETKYEGYIAKAKREAEKMRKNEKISLRKIEDYQSVPNLSLEAITKLNKIKPETLGQASRISGINPSDLEVIMIYLKRS
ncbi:MAG: tRNA uridine-5-carboxymethylaminomethyl(34) synthesis enzyme MnmG [Erysipelotrichaceae bacterium]|nr:tRNA uridine-5-carboxymethylaminomethyl(34) synthesis enzyme MnmG [Erysipelotrichaceae bacterium]